MKQNMEKILVVDDDPDVLLLVMARLRASGYVVVSAKDGEQAIDIFHKEQPALMVLDLGLPKLNGFEVCQRLKADPKDRETPIIILSAKSQEVDRVKSDDVGADAHMTKPFDPRALLERIGELLQQTAEKQTCRNRG